MAFNETVNRFAFRSTNAGKLEGATHTGVSGTPGEGRYIKIDLRVEDGVVQEAKWEANGCPASMACAAVICTMTCGKPVENARQISEKDVVVILRGLPEGKGAMADMAVSALNKALKTPVPRD